MAQRTRFLLTEEQLPDSWYNIAPDLPGDPGPLLDPRTRKPAAEEFLHSMFSPTVIAQAASKERWVEIPEPVREIYRLWRPTPLLRARRLEQVLDTPAHIYYKFEGVSPVGSHKPNTAVPQVFWAREEGSKGLTTETGAGQWGSALAMACNLFSLECHVFMVAVSYHQKPHRRVLMQTYGASVHRSPSTMTRYGRRLVDADPDCPGSLGIAISEAVETAVESNGSLKFALGSALSPVLMHQTVVGREALQQMELAGEYPDVLIGCVGGGSNFAGFTFPFLHHNWSRATQCRVIAVEPTACPSLTRGKYTYDYADTAGLAPIARMHTVGHTFVPPGIHAGGLRYHGMAPQVGVLYEHGDIEAIAVPQLATFRAAVQFARAEGIIPAPESAHAVCIAIEEALRCKQEGVRRVIAFNLSGHGHFDLAAYESYLRGDLDDFDYPAEAIDAAIKELPNVEVGH